MKLQTFKAPTLAEAIAQVKTAMGHDAFILHTRTYQRSQWLGLRRRTMVEITATPKLNMVRPNQAAKKAVAYAGATYAPTAPQSPRPQPAAPVGYGVGTALLDTPAANRAVIFDVSSQLQSLKEMVKDLARDVHHQAQPQVPKEMFEHFLQLKSNRVCEDLAVEIVGSVYKQLRGEQIKQADLVRDRLAEHIEKLIPTGGPIKKTKSHGPHVVALIGPTGVGKTTTIAKLAANLQLKEKKKVGLITIDTYRIAAIDQLKKYADIIGSNLRVVGSPEDLRNAVASMNDCEYVLIDTAGRSPNDALKLSELKNFLASAAPDEVHLVLSMTCSQEAVELAIDRFANVRADRMIFTKLDEAPHVGMMLNIVRKVNKSVSYLTTGQDVPDDIEDGRPKRLTQLILGSNL